MQFRFAHRTLEPQDEPVVEQSRMVDTVGIADQGIGHATKVEQTIPVDIIACEAGDFEPQNDPYMPQCDVGGQLGKAGSLCRAGPGKAQILIDDGNLIPCPTEIHGAVDQSVLTRSGLPVVLDLCR
jgi:hypothetical protein